MGKYIIKYFFRQLIFWFLFFAVGRSIFLLYNIEKLRDISVFSIFASYFHALYLDLSASCYLQIIPFLLLFLQSLIRHKILVHIMNYYFYLMLFIISLIVASELGIYDEWGMKLHYKVLPYLAHPSEVVHSVSKGLLTLLISILFAQFILGVFIYKKYVFAASEKFKRNYVFSILFFILMPGLLLLGLRGGTRPIPINQSASYFSEHNILNIAAVNSFWNFGFSIDQNYHHLNTNPYTYFSLEEAKKNLAELYETKKDTSIIVIKNQRPNIVFVLLESWSAGLMHTYGAKAGVTPFLDSLAKESFVFENIFANGERSEQGMAAIFSGFPSQPVTSILRMPDKFQKLPCISNELHAMGYKTSFYFGGQLSYGNIKAYMIYNRFGKVIEETDFPYSTPRGRLGIHDQYVYDFHIEELNKMKQPFFSAVFNLSSHAPFDMPMKKVIHWGGTENNYLNSAYYTDSCLASYFGKAKKQSWYANTLFVIVADHAHPVPGNNIITNPDYRRIPLMLCGGALKEEYKGKRFSKKGSQLDIPAILLGQLGVKSDAYKWSKNILNPYTGSFAFYTFVEGFGFIKEDDYAVYDHTINQFIEKKFSGSDSATVVNQGKSYLEILFQQYLDF